MTLEVLFGAVGLWAGIRALRMSWVPRLTQIATVAVLVSGFVVMHALMGLLAAMKLIPA